MGNYVSCVSYKVPSNVLQVIALDGNVQEFAKPMKAAELMLENPQHFVCHSTVLEAGRRISALAADEDVELGHLYFLLPMRKLHSSLSPSDMASLAFKANSALHKSTSIRLAKILPVLGDLCHCSADRNLAAHQMNEEVNGVKEKAETKDIVFVPKLQVDYRNDAGEVRGLSVRTMSCKYWKPALETISEHPSNLPIAPFLPKPKKGNHLLQSYSGPL